MGEQRLRVLRQRSKRCCTCSNGLPEADTVLVFIGHPPSRIAWTADDTNSFSRIHAGLPKGHDLRAWHRSCTDYGITGSGVTQMSRETRRKRQFEVSYQCHMNCDEWRQKVNKDRKEKVNLTTPI